MESAMVDAHIGMIRTKDLNSSTCVTVQSFQRSFLVVKVISSRWRNGAAPGRTSTVPDAQCSSKVTHPGFLWVELKLLLTLSFYIFPLLFDDIRHGRCIWGDRSKSNHAYFWWTMEVVQ